MAIIQGPIQMVAVGTTGNITGTGFACGNDIDKFTVLFVVEAVGGTPTVTVALQGSLDIPEITDANAKWFNLPLIDNQNDTVAATKVYTTVANNALNMSNVVTSRICRRVRVVTTANTNVTFSAQLIVHSEF